MTICGTLSKVASQALVRTLADPILKVVGDTG